MVIAGKQLPLVQTVKKVKMTLIKSISGIRGTLENIPGESLSDFDIKQFNNEMLSEQSQGIFSKLLRIIKSEY